ncbi:antA/AntB antirepressor family protein [Fibrella aquatica]|uniref:antA/AntB antirepressor family protein n=1 Tax=Fibrella aquatica TaxID=3242487 RepID=UPI0035224D03
MIQIHHSKKGTPYIVASDFHRELSIDTPLEIWFPQMIAYGFGEGDYFQYSEDVKMPDGNVVSRLNWSVKLEMAKNIAVIQRSPQGKALREHLIELERKLTEGVLLTREQILALIDITKVMGFFSVQAYLETEHHDLFVLANKSDNWWSYRALLFGFGKAELKEMVEALGKKYQNQRQALYIIDKYELIRIATIDLFLALGKTREYALNIGRTANELAQTMGIQIYEDRGMALDFTTDREKAMIDQIKNRKQKQTLLDKF